MAATTITRAAQVIDAAREQHQIENAAAIRKLQLAVQWVELHPGDEVDDESAEGVDWSMRDLQIAGAGAPTIDEGAVAEFALAVGLSTDAGRDYLGDAVELAHRLPRIWHRVLDGRLPVWKARKIARATHSLPPAGAGFVDRALYFVAHKCTFAELDRQVEKARAEHDPAETERRRLAAAEQRHFKVHLKYMTAEGLVPISGMLDVADAVALDAVVAAKADTLDPALPLEVRRAIAAGLLGDPPAGQPRREVVIYAHTRPGQTMVDLDNTRSVITPEHLQHWCQQAGTKVTVRPVIDLNEELATETYQATPVMKEQVRLRHPECPFPFCHRPSWRQGQHADTDHTIEWPLGATTTSNLAPLCRGHHRLKTFTDWTYHHAPGTGFIWTSPLGHRHTG
ncbi:HNH endonuclease signature motif containing protein [Nocardioides sp. HB32]